MTDTMIVAGAHRLAELSPAIKTQNASSSKGGDYEGEALLPDFGDAPKINFEVAVAVAEQAVREGNSYVGDGQKLRVEDVRERAKEKVWVPVYPEYVYDPKGLQ